jgi:hypothetical protein
MAQNWISAPASARERWLLFLLFLIATVERLPRVVFEGRFWGEEGRVFYLHAATTAGLGAIFWPFAGYLNIGATAGAFAARHLVPLDDAPRVTLFFAALPQICPALLLVTSRAEWLDNRLVLAAALLLLVAAPSAEEVWLNTLHSQFFLALSAALILALEIGSRRMEWFRRFLLFAAPLYGPPAIMLLPLFAARAALEWSGPRAKQATALAIGSAIQLALFYHLPETRSVHNFRLIFGTIFEKNILLPFLGFDGEARPAIWLYSWLVHDVLPRRIWLALVAALTGMLILLARGPREAWWLFLAFGIINLLSWYGALLPTPYEVLPHLGGRYAFVPQVLMAWSILAVAARGTGSRRVIAAGLILWLCGASGLAYLQPGDMFSNGPDWRQEMVKWHHDPSYRPKEWPAGWLVYIQPHRAS